MGQSVALTMGQSVALTMGQSVALTMGQCILTHLVTLHHPVRVTEQQLGGRQVCCKQESWPVHCMKSENKSSSTHDLRFNTTMVSTIK